MRLILPESARPRKRTASGTLVSAVVHAVVIGGAIAATGWTAESPRGDDATRENVLAYVRPDEPRVTPQPERKSIIPTNVVPTEQPPMGLNFDVREGFPPIDLVIGTALVDSFARLPVAGGATGSAEATAHPPAMPMTSATVERIVVPYPGNPAPRYPSMLAGAGVEGEVVTQYVVDTLGRVERESVVVLRSDMKEFERAVRDALAKMRFVPAEAGGRRVRQLVEQRFTFALAPR